MDLTCELELEKYNKILNDINNEHEKCEELKRQIISNNDEILMLKLGESCKNLKISHVNVKVFNSPSEILNLYCDELKHVDINYLNKFNSFKFFLIEVYISKGLLQKLQTQSTNCGGWKLQINIESNEYSTSKICSLTGNNIPVFDVVPVSNHIKESLVSVTLFKDENCSIIDLNSVLVDISYHFESKKEQKHKYKHLNESLFKLTKLYASKKEDLALDKEIIIEGLIQCQKIRTKSEFIDVIMKNSYHRLELIEHVDENLDEMSIKFFVFNQEINLVFNPNSKVIQFKCGKNIAYYIQRFFLQYAEFHFASIQDKLKKLAARQIANENPAKVMALYKEMRQVWLE